jgi:transcription initiation factor TFIIB
MDRQRVSLDSLPVERCPECGGYPLNRDKESVEVVCTKCGFVVDTDLTDSGPEWRAFTPEQRMKKARVGAPNTFTLHDKGLSTQIDWRDFRGFSAEKKAQLHRLRKWQHRTWINGSTEKNLTLALSEMRRIADALNLPRNIQETTSIIYRKALRKRLIRGRSIQGVVVAAVYLACRQCGVIRTMGEFSHASGIPNIELTRNYRLLVNELKYFVPPVKPNEYVKRLSNQLTLLGKADEVAHKILKAATRLKLTLGREPKGIAAAAGYIATIVCGESRTQREFAEAADVTEVTIRNRYKEMARKMLITVSL